MAILFPSGLDDLANPTSTTSQAGHGNLHSDISDALLAIETKLGVDNSVDTNSIDYIVKKLIGVPVIAEVLTGNGVDVNFTLANTPRTGTVMIFQNGARIKETEEYTVSGAVITFNVAPVATDNILVDYYKNI